MVKIIQGKEIILDVTSCLGMIVYQDLENVTDFQYQSRVKDKEIAIDKPLVEIQEEFLVSLKSDGNELIVAFDEKDTKKYIPYSKEFVDDCLNSIESLKAFTKNEPKYYTNFDDISEGFPLFIISAPFIFVIAPRMSELKWAKGE